jgi:hypothetical protein
MDLGYDLRVAKTADEAKDLIEIGFDYVNEINYIYTGRESDQTRPGW